MHLPHGCSDRGWGAAILRKGGRAGERRPSNVRLPCIARRDHESAGSTIRNKGTSFLPQLSPERPAPCVTRRFLVRPTLPAAAAVVADGVEAGVSGRTSKRLENHGVQYGPRAWQWCTTRMLRRDRDGLGRTAQPLHMQKPDGRRRALINAKKNWADRTYPAGASCAYLGR